MIRSKKSFIFTVSVSILFLTTAVVFSKDSSVFKKKCGRCHAVKNPGDYSSSEWTRHVKRMAKRAKLTDQELKDIIDMKK